MGKPPPVTAAQIPLDWIDDVRGIILSEGRAVRAGAGNKIEVKSLTTNEWYFLTPEFQTERDRDIILQTITRKPE